MFSYFIFDNKSTRALHLVRYFIYLENYFFFIKVYLEGGLKRYLILSKGMDPSGFELNLGFNWPKWVWIELGFQLTQVGLNWTWLSTDPSGFELNLGFNWPRWVWTELGFQLTQVGLNWTWVWIDPSGFELTQVGFQHWLSILPLTRPPQISFN